MSEKRDINMKATLSAVKERQERLSQIKEKNMKKSSQDTKIATGIQLLYNIMKPELPMELTFYSVITTLE